MKSKWIAIGIGILVVIVAVGFAWARNGEAAGSNLVSLEATGTIEDRKAALGSEIGGQVTEVLVEEGQTVQAGQPLVQLDDSLLKAQRDIAAANLASAQSAVQTAQSAYAAAQARYQQALEAALAQDQGTRLQDWFSKDPKQFDQPNWYFSRAEQVQVAQTQVDVARQALDEANSRLADATQSRAQADFLAAEARLQNARLAYLITKQVNERAQNSAKDDAPAGWFNATHCGTNDGYRLATGRLTNQVYGCTGDQQLTDASQQLYDDSQAELTAAQQVYNRLLGTEAAGQLLKARAEASVLQERYYAALDHLRGLQTGDQSPSVKAAQEAMEQAKSAVQQAQGAVDQAQANVALLNVKLGKLTLRSPTDGVVLTRTAEVGEMAVPGATLIAVGRLDQLELTVYLPEEKFGLLKPGQNVQVRVDAYADRVFGGTVLRMANEAEFTPTHVQTKEDRTGLVYAVVIRVDNPDLALKPGMIADVDFPTADSK